MRNYQTLDRVDEHSAPGILSFVSHLEDDDQPRLALKREGDHLLISASYGALEIALRLRFSEFTRTLTHLQPIEGLGSSRQIGSSQSYLSFGLNADGTLLLRPTIGADATGRITMNLALTDDLRQNLMAWLEA